MFRILIAACLFLLSSCARKSNVKTIYDVPEDSSLFIEMPVNLTVFENIAPSVYNVLWNHFRRVGFVIGTEEENDFKLETKILKLEHTERFVSPDVLPYIFKVQISLECKLFDNNALVVAKQFDFYKWVSRPRDPVLNWTFLLAQYVELLEKSVHRIDQFFRPFIVIG